MSKIPLWTQMRERAKVDRQNAANLNEKADALETATAGFYAEPQTVPVKSFVGAWARARRAWCESTGEPLI